MNGTLLTIDDPRSLASNGSCISAGGGVKSSASSMTILAGSLVSNQTYQMMVRMQNRQNSTGQAKGFLLVRVQDNQPQLVVIG